MKTISRIGQSEQLLKPLKRKEVSIKKLYGKHPLKQQKQSIKEIFASFLMGNTRDPYWFFLQVVSLASMPDHIPCLAKFYLPVQ